MIRLIALLLALVAAPAAASPKSGQAAILSVVHHMEAAWNRGDFRGYMAGFSNPGVVFVSDGKFQAGWQGTLDHYVRDYGGSPERRGRVDRDHRDDAEYDHREDETAADDEASIEPLET